MHHKKKILIIGAGLSGLYTALLLKESYDIIVLEARGRLGGRVLTQDGHDLGPSWIWPHQKNILKLVHDLGLTLFSQYTKGDALYHTMQAVQRFNAPPSAPSARLVGGLSELINALASKLNPECIRLNQEVKKISFIDSRLSLETSAQKFEADYIISTLAPRLASTNITYTPDLDRKLHEKMLQTHTWMGNSAKCVIEFEKAFWKEKNLSGFVFSYAGPLSEIHDACTREKSALFGFLHPKASLQNLEQQVREQIETLFPHHGNLITRIYFLDWREEKFSSTINDRQVLSLHPAYGMNLQVYEKKLFFIGTETAFKEGGYLEGAINSARKLMESFDDKELFL